MFGDYNAFGEFVGVIIKGVNLTYDVNGFPDGGTVNWITLWAWTQDLTKAVMRDLPVTDVATLNADYPGWSTPDQFFAFWDAAGTPPLKVWQGDTTGFTGSDQADTLAMGTYSGELFGAGGDDLLYGGIGNANLYGGSGNDRMYGGDDGDLIYTGSGDDIALGGAGRDTFMVGGEGSNTLSGGADADVLYFANSGASGDMLIKDFDPVDEVLIIQYAVATTPQDQLANFIAGAVQAGQDVIWTNDAGTHSITLNNTALTDLTVDNFFAAGDTPYETC